MEWRYRTEWIESLFSLNFSGLDSVTMLHEAPESINMSTRWPFINMDSVPSAAQSLTVNTWSSSLSLGPWCVNGVVTILFVFSLFYTSLCPSFPQLLHFVFFVIVHSQLMPLHANTCST